MNIAALIKKLTFLFFILIHNLTFGQTFLNGDFEINTAGGIDQINLTNPAYNAMMANSVAFGSYGDMDIITSAVYSGGPQSGLWYVALTGGGTDMCSLTLSAPLVLGTSYTISFYDKGDANFVPTPVIIGLSNTNSSFGTLIYTAPSASVTGMWTNRTFTFTAPLTGQYITVSQLGTLANWTQVDHFTFGSCALTIDLGNDTTICQGQALALNATTPNSTYLWQDNSTNPTFNVTAAGTYTVTVTDNNSCVGTDAIQVAVSANPTPTITGQTSFCQ
ncbi:MAG: hypothetical protein WCQ95_13675, partial [Bacteroidota bacterium]